LTICQAALFLVTDIDTAVLAMCGFLVLWLAEKEALDRAVKFPVSNDGIKQPQPGCRFQKD